MGVKDNFSQALSELTGIGKPEESDDRTLPNSDTDRAERHGDKAGDSEQYQPNKQSMVSKLFQQTKGAPGVTIIAPGTIVVGEVNAEGDVELLGSVRGKVLSQGNIKMNGKIVGDLAGHDIDLKCCAVQGNITATGSVNVDGDSLVIGDIRSESFSLDGKVKGNVYVEKEAKFQPKAILAGNVTAVSITMSQGSKIQGAVNIPLSDNETNESFDIEITI